jgi:hypothetical protein
MAMMPEYVGSVGVLKVNFVDVDRGTVLKELSGM